MRPVLPALVFVTLVASPAIAEDYVVLDGPTWVSLQPHPEKQPDPELLPGPFAAFRDVRVDAREDGAAVTIRWDLDAFEPGWLNAVLVGRDLPGATVLWNGGPAAWDSGPNGIVVTGYIDGPTTIEVRADVDQALEQSALNLPLLGALRDELVVNTPAGFEPVLGDGAVALPRGRFSLVGNGLSLRLSPATTARVRRTLAVGEVGVGLTVGDSVLTGRARLRWKLRRGELSKLSFSARGVGADLAITGTTVRSVARSGDRVTVELQAPATDLVTLDLSWTTPLPTGTEGELPVPTFVQDDVGRAEASLQLARDGEWEALPTLDGWRGRSGSALPEFGQGLVGGSPTAAFVAPRSDRGGALGLLRYEPVSGPELVVDVADYLVATTSAGRTLVRARYEMLNDRAAFVRIELPDGAQLLSVRVQGEAATPAREEGALRIPLPRSLETMEGAITYPVEVAYLSDGEPWGRREDRELQLPHVEAPVAVARVTLHLPPGYAEVTGRRAPGHRVDSFNKGEGISYGFAMTTGEDRSKADEADVLFQSAVTSWMDNDFDEAQARLDELGALGASNDNTVRLQSNIDVVTEPDPERETTTVTFEGEVVSGGLAGAAKGSGRSSSSAGESMRRRVREQARARAEEEHREYEQTARQAEEKELAGDFDGAEEDYRRALELGDKLEGLEQEESAEVSDKNMDLHYKMERSRGKKKGKDSRDRKSGAFSSKPAAAPKRPASKTRATVQFDGDDVLLVEGDDEFDYDDDGEWARGIGDYEPPAEPVIVDQPVRGPALLPPADPVVTSSNRSVLVPRIGNTVLYQQLLLPTGGDHVVVVRARLPRSEGDPR